MRRKLYEDAKFDHQPKFEFITEAVKFDQGII